MSIFSLLTGLTTLFAPATSIASDTDMSLVLLAKKGDRKAFAALLEKHYTMIYNVAYRFTGHSHDAEDITQDVCMALADKIKFFQGDSQFKTWLYTLIVNACKDAYRKNSRLTKLEGYFELEAELRENNQQNQQNITWLYRELAKLEEPLRMTAFLVLAEDLTHAQVGKIVNCTESTVSWRMAQIRKHLQTQKELIL